MHVIEYKEYIVIKDIIEGKHNVLDIDVLSLYTQIKS